ncbi:ComF family protein [Phorcysia thermohydrogeniphila]|uniref:ComF family protein n=1 Tax=Phorcysia thermohydrogeniphila TaxID=936138 RepID=A0A4R1GEM5_9BACT|nr:ComF family protein [Phorcysia thermohydrogeniphila]TCK05260.1 ComF family protein [Phorcysia thermohydrogeniphila]
MNWLLDLLFPEYCVVCGSFLFLNHHHIACEECWRRYFTPYHGKKCLSCGHPVELLPGSGDYCKRCLISGKVFEFDKVEFFALYDGLVEIALRALKFDKKLSVAYSIGKTIGGHLKSFILRNRVEVVIPVPLHKDSLKERGFNQCEEILKGARVAFSPLLEKIYKTPQQSSLNEKEREKNVKGVFSLTGNVKGKRVLIFDDIFTTGSTVNEIVKVLKENGASNVFVYTVAYTPVQR